MSALLLDRHFFTSIELKPNPDAKPEGELRVTCNLAMGHATDDPLRYQATLKVDLQDNPDSPSKPYYFGSLEVVGFFRVSPAYKDDPDKLVNISGASLLYGSIRELVCNLTARGPWGMVTLPTVNFTPQPAPAVPAETKTLAPSTNQ
jgi:preprotein translocase subunit SecB